MVGQLEVIIRHEAAHARDGTTALSNFKFTQASSFETDACQAETS
jgi:hypothetical protein